MYRLNEDFSIQWSKKNVGQPREDYFFTMHQDPQLLLFLGKNISCSGHSIIIISYKSIFHDMNYLIIKRRRRAASSHRATKINRSPKDDVAYITYHVIIKT
jgi:hypothetical protein